MYILEAENTGGLLLNKLDPWPNKNEVVVLNGPVQVVYKIGIPVIGPVIKGEVFVPVLVKVCGPPRTDVPVLGNVMGPLVTVVPVRGNVSGLPVTSVPLFGNGGDSAAG